MTLKMFGRHVTQLLACLMVAALCSCRDDEPSVEYRTIAGTVERVEPATRRVTLRYLHEKSGQHRQVEGVVVPDAEIFINGKLSSLADIRIGEHVVVHGRIEKLGKDKRISALRIDISRDETITFNAGAPDSGG